LRTRALKNTQGRVTHSQELNQLFAAWCAQHTLAQVLDAFDKAQGTIAPIYSIDQIEADPQMQARQAICNVPDADFGTVRMATVVPRFANNPSTISRSGGDLGHDTDAFYAEHLQLSPDDIKDLRAAGVI
jgi:crotonobetainyl-CoA:carnitine CoA-transferase CaiB-like acyl-CoA transferase